MFLFIVFVFIYLFCLAEPPVTIVRKMEDQKFPDGALISIECELSRHNVDVKWMKASANLFFPSSFLDIFFFFGTIHGL